MYVNSSAGGTAQSSNDVCKTPPAGIPVNFTNTGRLPEAGPNVPNILYGGGSVHNLSTTIKTTRGDEGGSMGGVASGTVASTSRNSKGSSAVFIQGAPQTRLSDTTLQNNQNASGSNVAPSQTIYQTLR